MFSSSSGAVAVPCTLAPFTKITSCPGRGYQDVTFRAPSNVTHITFDNRHTHRMAVLHRTRESTEWVTAVPSHATKQCPVVLMQNPWTEADAKATHVLELSKLFPKVTIDTTTLYHLRFHLFQPAVSQWGSFGISNVRCYNVTSACALTPPSPSTSPTTTTLPPNPSPSKFMSLCRQEGRGGVEGPLATMCHIRQSLRAAEPRLHLDLYSVTMPPGAEATTLL